MPEEFHARASAYRRTAARIRSLAATMHGVDCRDQLVDLARRFERLAARLEGGELLADDPLPA